MRLQIVPSITARRQSVPLSLMLHDTYTGDIGNGFKKVSFQLSLVHPKKGCSPIDVTWAGMAMLSSS